MGLATFIDALIMEYSSINKYFYLDITSCTAFKQSE